MNARLIALALISGTLVPSLANDSQRLSRLEAEVAELKLLLYQLTNKTESRPLSKPTISENASRYKIRSGDSYWSIARRHGVSISSLQAANPGINPRRLSIGKLIHIPGSTPTQPMSTRSGTYRVKKGDILGRISEAHGIRLHQLLSANPGLNPRRLKIGTVLNIPGQAQSSPLRKTPAKQKTSKSSTPFINRSNPYLSEIGNQTQSPNPAPENTPLGGVLDKPRLVIIEETLRFAEIAERHQTTVEQLNKLNKRDLSPKQMIAGGSQLYVPSR